MFSLIAAVGKKKELGKKGGLCFVLPNDLRHFKKITQKHKVMMGSATFASLPKMLPGRKHIVLTRGDEKYPEEVDVYHHVDEIIKLYKDTDEEVFVIGGGSIYKLMLPYCNKLYLTEVNATDKEADTFFPDFNKSEFIRGVTGSEVDNGYQIEYVEYVRKERL